MPAGQAVSRFGSGIFLHGMPARQAVSRFWSGIFLHGVSAGQAVSRFGSGIFFYTGCPQGRPCLGLGRVSFFFFFFVVLTNLHINLFI